MEPIKVNEYIAVKLEDQGKYGFALIEGRTGTDGEFKLNWCKKSFGKRGEEVEKNVPVKISLGTTKQKAIDVLEALLFELQENAASKNGDVPF